MNPSQLPPLQLNRGADKRLRKGHLWVYSNEIDTQSTPLKALQAGQQVRLLGEKQRTIGLATVNPKGLICARVFSRNPEQPLDKSLLVHRFNQALSLRERFFSAPYYRLAYGDSDLLPGLVVDRFSDHLVVQISTAGMEALSQEILDALDQCFRPQSILFRNDHSARELEGLPLHQTDYGPVPEFAELIENDTRFLAPLKAGQKTGWFYDHRMNRAMLQTLCKGKRVLDVFSYAGGWGVQAAVAGAKEAVCVDASVQALAWTDENASLNDVGEKVTTMQGKAIDVMKTLLNEETRFDVVVLDPPAFIKRRKDQKSGEAAYYHVNELGMRLLARDGLLVSGSCSMHLSTERLVDLVRSAGRKIDRQVQIVHRGGQGPDHPAHPAIPETDYLKALFARVYRD
ncbi:MAG: class I SAM-dependent rRNA methyltransferase [Pseudomonadota bacterium]